MNYGYRSVEMLVYILDYKNNAEPIWKNHILIGRLDIDQYIPVTNIAKLNII